MLRPRLIRALFGCILWMAGATTTLAQAQPFVHPGGLFKSSDMERMRDQVAAKIEPWFSSFQELQNDSRASYDYLVRGDPSWTTVSRDPCVNCGAFQSDTTAAYLNALMWIVTEDRRHADKSVEIFNTWKNLTEVRGGGTASLNAGLFAWKLVEAAEIIRGSFDGWAGEDFQDFQAMLVYPGYSNEQVPPTLSNTNGTFYWRIYNGDPGRHGNQDMIAWRAMISMGVFLDNRIMYDRALRYFKGLPARPDDLPYPSGPSPSGSQLTDNEFFTAFRYVGSQGTIQNYGYNGVLKHYIWENGQNQESSRDQQHAFFGLGIAAGIAEVAWNQGDDVWNSLDHRLLKGFEFMAKYNTSYITRFPDQPEPWEPENFIQRTDRTGRWFSKKINPHFESDFIRVSRGEFSEHRPIYEQAVAHFNVRMGLEKEAVWTFRSREVAIAESGYEKTGWSLDHPGWGALSFRRPPQTAGDPISGFSDGAPVFQMNRVPGTIEAINFDYFPGDGEGRTYHDKTPGNAASDYRGDAVDIGFDPETGYFLTDLEDGEWITYTVSVPSSGWYRIGVSHASANGEGTVRFAFAGNDVTGEVSLPDTGGLANWTEQTVAERLYLQAGVQAMRLFIGGESGSFTLRTISIDEDDSPLAPPQPPANLSAEAVSAVEIELDWGIVAETFGYSVKRATASGGPYLTVATGVVGSRFRDSGLIASTTYYYVVTAGNDAGESAASLEVSATTLPLSYGSWAVDADGSWTDASNWINGNIADGTGARANFGSIAITGNRLVSLDGNRTVGSLLFGASGVSHTWGLVTGTEGELTLETGLGRPAVEVRDSVASLGVKITGASGLKKTGAGILILGNNANDFTGGILVDRGTLRATGTAALGPGNIVVNEGGTFDFGPGFQVSDKLLTIAGGGAGGSAGAFYVNATGLGSQTRWGLSGINPAIILVNDATIHVDGDGSGPNTATFLIGRTDLNGHILTKRGTGRLSFDTSGNGLQGSGAVYVMNGVLGFRGGAFAGGRHLTIATGAEARVGGDNNAFNSTGNLVTINGTLNLNGRSDTTGFSQTIGLLAGDGLITTGTLGNTGMQTLTISHNSSADSFFAGRITEANGVLNLVKAGSNTLTLAGSNEHRGNTTVSGGTLVLGATGTLSFYPEASGSNNSVLGTGQVDFRGSLIFDLSQVSVTLGDSWSIVDTQNLTVSFGDRFAVAGFTRIGDVWGTNENGVGYQFEPATGQLKVVAPIVLPQGFELWRNARFSSAELGEEEISGPTGDPEGDGISNLMEYALGGEPRSDSGGLLPVVELRDGFLEITFRRIKEVDDVVYRVEASADLQHWEIRWSSEDHPYAASEEFVEETVADVEPITQNGRRFLRLMVTLER